MKFSDIKPFTPTGNYAVDISLKYLPKAIKEYETDYGLELNPDFQRGNVWPREQQIAYLEFFFRGGKSGRDIYFNQPETADTDIPNMVCVDGLQRLTAFLGFMNNEISIFGGHYYKDFEDGLRQTEHTLRIHINNLQWRKDVLQWYLEMNTGGTVHSKEELERVTKLYEKECKRNTRSEMELV